MRLKGGACQAWVCKQARGRSNTPGKTAGEEALDPEKVGMTSGEVA